MAKIILSLFDYTGNWSQPYVDAGYEVVRLDKQNGDDVVLTPYLLGGEVHGVLAAPPCTEFAGSGARWWRDKDPKLLLDGLALIDATYRIVAVQQPKWWCLENPIGRLPTFLGPPKMYFDPCDYGDPYTKKTALWGNFNQPIKNRIQPTQGSKMHLIPPGPNRANLRSATPKGFAKAFFEANP
tara:strand:- start:18657 stop:19205 length:549 start_codon:yes stop_codon:yes gene_type:complete